MLACAVLRRHLPATTVVMGSPGCMLSGFQGTAGLLKFFNGENGACFRCCAHAAGLHSVKNLQVVGECTGHAVRGGSNIVLMAQECTSLIVPVAKKLISRIWNSLIPIH